MDSDQPPRGRLELVLEVDDPATDALLIWLLLHAEQMTAQLDRNGVIAKLVSIGIDGEPRYRS